MDKVSSIIDGSLAVAGLIVPEQYNHFKSRQREVRPMRTHLIIKHIVLVASLALMMGIPALSIQAAEQPAEVSMTFASAEELGVAASGAVEDTLRACLARIPKDASVGQRMLAEQSCQQDEATRKLVQSAPKF
jgi:hypothetical protein